MIAAVNKVLQTSIGRHHGESEFQVSIVNLIYNVLIISLQGTICIISIAEALSYRRQIYK